VVKAATFSLFLLCCSDRFPPPPPKPPLVPLVHLYAEQTRFITIANFGVAADGRVFPIGGDTPVDALKTVTGMSANVAVISLGTPDDSECATLADGRLLCRGATSSIPGHVMGMDCGNPGYCVPDEHGTCQPSWFNDPTYYCVKDWVVVPAPSLHELQGNCAIDASGTIQCWNDPEWSPRVARPGGPLEPQPSHGNLGVRSLRSVFAIRADGALIDLRSDIQIPGIGPVVDACGDPYEDVSCALTVEGRVYCWGSDGFDSGIGDGTIGRHDTPTLVGTQFSAVSCGAAMRCAIETGGQVDCWGDTDDSDLSPRKIDGVTAREIVVAGFGVFLTLNDDGSVEQIDLGRKTRKTIHPTK
jgi:hypothetical protein